MSAPLPAQPTFRQRPEPRSSKRARSLGVRRVLAATLSLALPIGLAATVVVAANPGAESAPTDIAPVAAALASAPLNTFTLNVLHDLAPDAARADMDRAMTLGDVGGFQEMSDAEDRTTLIALCAAKDFGYYMPPEGGLAIPIVWNRARFRLIDGHTTLTHGPTADGSSPSRFVNVVRLRELATGKVFGFINTHTISNASFDAQLSDMGKIPLLRTHLQILRNEILALAAQTENVFVSGDLNVNYLADRNRKNPGLPTSALGDIVDFDMPNTGSHGTGSLLDYGMTLKHDSGLALQSSNIVYDFNSDHDAVQFHYAPVNVFGEAATTNDPQGDTWAQHDVVDRQLRALADSEAGATVRLVTQKLDDQAITDQLTAAAARGVNVQIVVGPGSATAQEAALGTVLGATTTAPSFLKRCASGCTTGATGNQANVLLVDRTGSATNLSLAASGPMVSKAPGTDASVFQTTDDKVYAAYAGLFSQYVTGVAGGGHTVKAGSRRVLVSPTTKDPVIKALGKVKCVGAKGTKGARTHVMASVQSWSGKRGKSLVAELSQLRSEGCNVDVVRGKKVGKGIKRQLKAARLDSSYARIAQNSLLIEGRYKKSRKATVALVGGPTWSDSGLKDDGSQLMLKDATSVAPYVDQFDSLYRKG